MSLIQDAGPAPMPPSLVVLGVLVCLGFSMMLGSALMHLGTRWWFLLGAACLLAPNVLLPQMSSEAAGHSLALLLIAPGQSALVASGYPLLPWFGICAFGVGYGRLLRQDAGRCLRAALPAGLALIVLFVAIRAGGGFGNLRLADGGGWIAWLTVVKYPPSLAFASLMLGLDLLLLWLLDRARRRLRGLMQVLIVYGQAPLFFYIAHFYLFGVLSITLFRKNPAPQWLLYPCWLLGVALLYEPCRRFGGFKQRQPAESLWRLL